VLIHAGNHRAEAHELAGHKTVPVIMPRKHVEAYRAYHLLSKVVG